MSTETPSPPPEVAEAERRAQEAIAAAEEAKRRYEALAAAQQTTAATPTPQQSPELLAELERVKARLASLDTIEARARADLLEARASHIRGMGLALQLRDEDLLKLAPDADPRTPEGRAAIESWRQSNPGLFRPRGPSPEQVEAVVKPRLDALRDRKTRLINPEVVATNPLSRRLPR